MTQKKILINMFMKAYLMKKKEAKTKVNRIMEEAFNVEINKIENTKFDTEGLSLFNNHVNNAGERAAKDMVNKYGQDIYDRHVGQYKDTGIMVILGHSKNEYTTFYLDKVHEYANGTWNY